MACARLEGLQIHGARVRWAKGSAATARLGPRWMRAARGGVVLTKVVVFTDGSSRGNPGPGGYGAVLRCYDPTGKLYERELSAGYARTTNNRMELMGVIAALEALKRPCEVEVHSDSQYVVNAFNQHWVDGWKRRGWKNAKKEPVKNPDLWMRLLNAMAPHQVKFVWVRGHAGTDLNERCDQLAVAAATAPRATLLDDEGFTD